jgi:hypothetical protein
MKRAYGRAVEKAKFLRAMMPWERNQQRPQLVLQQILCLAVG